MGRRPKYSKEVRSFIAENAAGMTTTDLVELVNTELGTDFTESKMRAFKKNHKLKSGIGSGTPAGLPTKLYPEKVRNFISENCVGVGHQAMADLLNKTFGASYTKEQMKDYYYRFKLNSGLKGYFKKGHIPFNKGMKGLSQGGEQTQFKKGNKPANWMPVGSERVNADGYIDVKIQDGKLQKNWKAKHIILWEEAHEPVPEGHVVIFADGDKLNVTLENLLLISRKELAVMNKRGLIAGDPDLTRMGKVVANVILKIGERKKRRRPADDQHHKNHP